MRRVVLTLVVALALVVTATASASVRLVSKTSSVEAGATASLTVKVTPARTCSISVYYATVVSKAKGLNRKSPKAGRYHLDLERRAEHNTGASPHSRFVWDRRNAEHILRHDAIGREGSW